MEPINTSKLITKEAINKPTYESSLVQGLIGIAINPYERKIDRHIQMALPNSLATTEGTEAYEFLKKAGKLKRTPEAGVVVTLSKGQQFISTKTGKKETTLLLDFEYKEAMNIDVVKKIMEI